MPAEWQTRPEERRVPPAIALAIHPHALSIRKAVYRGFVERVGEGAAPRGSKTRPVLETVGNISGTFSRADRARACPGMGLDTIRRVPKMSSGRRSTASALAGADQVRRAFFRPLGFCQAPCRRSRPRSRAGMVRSRRRIWPLRQCLAEDRLGLWTPAAGRHDRRHRISAIQSAAPGRRNAGRLGGRRAWRRHPSTYRETGRAHHGSERCPPAGQASPYSGWRESMLSVTGPSFTRCSCMSAPKIPVGTGRPSTPSS